MLPTEPTPTRSKLLLGLAVLGLTFGAAACGGCGARSGGGSGTGAGADGKAGSAPTLASVLKPPGELVAEVGPGGVSAEDYAGKAREKSRVLKKVPVQLGETERQALLDELVKDELLFQWAVGQGLLRDPFVRRRLITLAVEARTKAAGGEAVPDDETRKFYEENKERFKIGEQVCASHILIKAPVGDNDAEREKAMTRAKFVARTAAATPDKWADLAKEYSQAPVADGEGDLGCFTRDRMPKEFADVAFALQAGQISDVVATQFGFHVIKVRERKPEAYESLDAVHHRIEAELVQRRSEAAMAKFVEELRAQNPVTTSKERMESALRLPPPEAKRPPPTAPKPEQLGTPSGPAPGTTEDDAPPPAPAVPAAAPDAPR